MDFEQIHGLSSEVKQRLRSIRPSTIGAAKRMEGMTPASLLVLLQSIRKAQGLEHRGL